MAKKIALSVLTVLNLSISGLCAFLYFVFTLNAAIGTDATRPITVTMSQGGLSGGLYRLAFCALLGALLQAVLYIFNISVLGFVEADNQRAVRNCAFIGLGSWAFMIVFLAVKIGFDM